MKRTILTLTFALVAVFASAQNDSLSMTEKNHQLQEVVVKSNVALTSAEKSTYIPTRKQRNAATDAVALLQHMMIPQLKIDPMTESVQTIANEEVCIFIDFMPATKEDLQGMNTQDVKRVEVYDFPKDVRFQNKKHVVNFVMQKYEIGGYTKLTNTEMVLADFTTINSAYSKLAHKNWTFDANLSHRYFTQNHLGSESEETFNLPEQQIIRTETFADGKQRDRQASASLRVSYNSEKMQLSNQFELLDKKTPRQELSGRTFYQPSIINSLTTATSRTAHEITPTYQGNWNFFLPKDWQLSVSPQFQFTHNKQNRFYQEVSTIENDIKENASKLNWDLGLSKTFAGKHTFGLVNWGMNYHSDLEYTGSTQSRNKLNMFCNATGLSYQLGTEKFSFDGEVLLTVEQDNVDGVKVNQTYPIVNIYANYAPNSRHQIAATLAYNTGGADGAQRNPSIMQESEMLYYCGNPAIKDLRMYKAMLEYTWMPSNKFTASAYAEHLILRDNIAEVYKTHNNGAAILRTFDNADNLNNTDIGASLTLRLLDGNLQLSAQPELSILRVSGGYSEKDTKFSLNLNATYYLKQFYFMSGYKTPDKQYIATSAAWQRDRSFSYLIAGWGNAAWKARLEYVNPFRTDWRATKKTITTPLYTRTSTALNNNAHQHLTLTVSYLFNYGKKVKQGNELGTASGGQSSIL